MIYFSLNSFYVNISAISGLLNGDFAPMIYGSFIAEVEIYMLLIAAHFETGFRGRRCLRRATLTLINYKFLYYTYKTATVVLSLVSYHSW